MASIHHYTLTPARQIGSFILKHNRDRCTGIDLLGPLCNVYAGCSIASLVIQKPIITIYRCFLEFRIIVDGWRKNNVKENVKNYKEAVKTH